MSKSETQRGVLRKLNLTKMPTIRDHRQTDIEYTYDGTILPHTGRTGVVINDVKALDGHTVETSDYLFIVKGDGFFPKETHLILTNKGGNWRNVTP
jgi:hypothetical protein